MWCKNYIPYNSIIPGKKCKAEQMTGVRCFDDVHSGIFFKDKNSLICMKCFLKIIQKKREHHLYLQDWQKYWSKNSAFSALPENLRSL